MIELIGVLAVIAIMAALLVPAVTRRADIAAWTKESSDLSTISNALVLSALKNQTLQDEVTWTNVAANWLSLSPRQIALTPRGARRVFLIDTNGCGTLFNTPGSPYQQQPNGLVPSSAPTNARVMIVSTMGTALPVTSGRLSAAQFDAIWNTAPNAKPGTWTNWSGKGEDLLIQRINIQSLFRRLILVDHDTNSAPRFSIDMPTSPTTSLPVTQSGNPIRDRWYLDGTAVGLCDSSGTPMMKFQLTNDISFVFEGRVWQGEIGSGESSEAMAQGFADLSVKFLAAQWYPGAHQSGRGDQQGALTAMFNFMLVFSLWADQFPHYNMHGVTDVQVPEYLLLNALVGPSSGNPSSDLLNLFTGANGLLNK